MIDQDVFCLGRDNKHINLLRLPRCVQWLSELGSIANVRCSTWRIKYQSLEPWT
jgi:hypothetical protein